MVSNRRRWGGLIILSLALAIIIIDTTIINVSLRTIVGSLNTTVQTLQWVITGYALVVSAFTVTGGRLGDLFGRKRMFLLGAVIFAAGSLTAATAHSPAQLMLGASVIEGLGAALMLPATASLLLATFQGRERAIAFGIWGGVAGAAASVGPLLGGYLTTYHSWRLAYGINLGIVAVVLLMSWLITESREQLKRPTIDFAGIGLLALGLATIVFGIVESSTYGWIKAKEMAHLFGHMVNLGYFSFVIFALILGLLILVIFAMWQAIMSYGAKTPLISPKLFNRGFTAGVGTMSIVAMGQFGMFFTLPVFWQSVNGLNAFHTGLAFLPFSLSVFFAAPLSGIVGSKLIGLKRVVILGLVIDLVGLVYLRHLISAGVTVHQLIPALVINGIGFGMAIANLTNITLSSVNVQEAGEASGVNNTARQLGATLGTAILGAVLLAAIQTNMTNGIHASRVLPAQLKPVLAAGVRADIQSLGVGSSSAQAARLPASVANELVSIRNHSIADGVRKALAYGAGILGVGVLASLALPGAKPHSVSATPGAEPSPQPIPQPAPQPAVAVATPPPTTRGRRPLKL
jgi:EmrB/QacA subfamily drug resistance transporter